eukprot:TRINITY_DN6731_c0_g1_i1.p1 TRINITY_DN6731_c0_g1~~TRINITY_DN6731_c0_g1_i1.p1  ORF type:complete len:852 (+),score=113.97 TRINITY_DN6731_c0_g1_i1:28-2556(+)
MDALTAGSAKDGSAAVDAADKPEQDAPSFDVVEHGGETAAQEGTVVDRIPWATKLLYAAPSMSMLPFVAMFSLYGTRNYESFGASLGMISCFTAFARSLDVISDPFMSYLTDSATTRFGRRRPFIAIGCVLYSSLLFFLLTPPYGTQNTLSAWFGVMYTLYYLTNTFFCIPYFALGPELSKDSKERTSLFLVMSVFEGVGTLVAMGLPMAATLQVRERNWNSWVCKPLSEQASLCQDGRSCGAVFVEGDKSRAAFRANETLSALLSSLDEKVALDASVRKACANWIREGSAGAAASVLGSAALPLQNSEFCSCMSTCDAACEIADERTGFMLVGWIFALWCVISSVACVCLVRERDAGQRKESSPLVPAMLSTLENGPFRVLLPAWACDAFSNAIVQSLTPYFVAIVTAPQTRTLEEHGMECGRADSPTYNAWFCDPQNVVAACGISVLIAAIAALPLWSLAVRWFGKVKVWWMWSLTMAATNCLFLFLGRGMVIPLLIVSALNGVPLGAKFLADSILGDIIDYDEFLTGQRNEATYMMFKSFLPKIVQIPAAALPIALLTTTGYVSPVGGVEQIQPNSVVIYIKIICFISFCVSVFSFLIKRRYPMAEESMIVELSQGLKAHQEGRAYPDPVTGLSYKPSVVPAEMQQTTWYLEHFSPGRLRRSFKVPRHLLPDHRDGGAAEAEAAEAAAAKAEPEEELDLAAGARRLRLVVSHQLWACILGLISSVSATAISFPLTSSSTWQFVPTLAVVVVGVFIVLTVLSSLRRHAAGRLHVHVGSGEFTTAVLLDVMKHQQLLARVGTRSNRAVPDAGNECKRGDSTLERCSDVVVPVTEEPKPFQI